MNHARNKYLLCNWIFIAGLFILFLNDHFLKSLFHNWLTGKISDFAGLLIFPMFLQFLFPRLSGKSSFFTGVLFIFWKSPFSQELIDLYNSIAFIQVTRVVDYTDLAAISALPLSHHFIRRIEVYRFKLLLQLSINAFWLLVPAVFIFMATSPPLYCVRPNGEIYIGKSYTLKMSGSQLLTALEKQGYYAIRDTSDDRYRNIYRIENAIVGRDTIKSVRFSVFENEEKQNLLLTIETVNLRGDTKLNDWKLLKRYSKHYQKLINGEIIKDLK